ncbi:hypothetical protein Dimus_017661 [Dionaea muscipula]
MQHNHTSTHRTITRTTPQHKPKRKHKLFNPIKATSNISKTLPQETHQHRDQDSVLFQRLLCSPQLIKAPSSTHRPASKRFQAIGPTEKGTRSNPPLQQT